MEQDLVILEAIRANLVGRYKNVIAIIPKGLFRAINKNLLVFNHFLYWLSK